MVQETESAGSDFGSHVYQLLRLLNLLSFIFLIYKIEVVMFSSYSCGKNYIRLSVLNTYSYYWYYYHYSTDWLAVEVGLKDGDTLSYFCRKLNMSLLFALHYYSSMGTNQLLF